MLDAAFVGMYGIGTLVAVSNDAGSAATPLLALGGAHTLSALLGNSRVKRCRKAYDEHQEWLANGRWMEERPALREAALAGKEGKACYPNQTCDAGLVCDEALLRCLSKEPVDSAPGDPADAANTGTDVVNASAEEPSEPWPEPLPVIDSPTAAPAVVTSPATPAPAPPPAAAPPVSAAPAPPAPPPAAPIEDSPPPPNEPPPAADDSSWADFWRERNR